MPHAIKTTLSNSAFLSIFACAASFSGAAADSFYR
jgi:hypothetical protein